MCIVGLHAGLVPPQVVPSTQATQVPLTVSHTGAPLPQAMLLPAEHWPQPPPGWQAGVVPPHSPSPPPPRQLLMAASPTGLAPLQSPAPTPPAPARPPAAPQAAPPPPLGLST